MATARRLLLASVVAASALAWNRGAIAAARQQATPALLDTVVVAEQRFLAQWYEAWKASQQEQHGMTSCFRVECPVSVRVMSVHCHVEYTRFSAVATDARGMPRRNERHIERERFIPSRNSMFAVCPSWYPPSGAQPPDERIQIDRALTARHQSGIRQARDSLIGLLRRAAQALPQNDFVAGQLVRFLVDQGDLQQALEETARCGARPSWCLVLRGYVFGRAGEFARAQSAYDAAIAEMPEGERCAWTDLSMLLDSAMRRTYQSRSCAGRDSLDTTIWWLADPLYIDPGNERRVEQNIRRTVIALHSALDRDERYDWRSKQGNDARVEMLGRYGWPAYTYWAGFAEDSEHTAWLTGPRNRSPINEPYTTYEYTVGRLHTVPNPQAIADPLRAQSSAWSLTAPKATTDQQWSDRLWWPREHFAPRLPVVQLPDPQTALLRRRDDVVLAVGLDLDVELLARASTETVNDITLMTTHRPDSILRIAQATGIVGGAVALWGQIPSRPTLVGVEFAGLDQGRPGGRTRYGIAPPPPLSAMQPGELAISNPVVLQPLGDGEIVPTRTDSALRFMAGSTRVQPAGRVGIYWETYGFTPTDTVEFAVWIERHTPQGIVRRFANSVRITQDQNTPIAITWEELPGAGRFHLIDGPVPIIGRSVAVDVSRLPKGTYWLDVAAKVPGRDAVRGRTQIVVQ